MDDVAVWIVAAGFAGMGLYALAAPQAMVALMGVTLTNADARGEARAVYGGFGLAIAGVLGAAAVGSGDLRQGILVAVGFALAGMAAGRLVSAVADGPAGLWPVWAFVGIEAGSAALLLAVAWA